MIGLLLPISLKIGDFVFLHMPAIIDALFATQVQAENRFLANHYAKRDLSMDLIGLSTRQGQNSQMHMLESISNFVPWHLDLLYILSHL